MTSNDTMKDTTYYVMPLCVKAWQTIACGSVVPLKWLEDTVPYSDQLQRHLPWKMYEEMYPYLPWELRNSN